MHIVVQGHSGCRLEIIKKQQNTVIKKTSFDATYQDRLKVQARKQQNFFDLNTLPFIHVPKVLQEDETSIYSFEMQYYPSLDFITYFQQADKNALDSCIKYLTEYFSFVSKKNILTSVSAECIAKKYAEVKYRSQQNFFVSHKHQLFTVLDDFFTSVPPTLELPIGFCHGDMTFSNILFNKHKKDMVLIDFLDSFIESPLQDMVKLRQDTRYHWSFNLYSKEFDKTKMSIILGYLDEKLHSMFTTHNYYNEYYYLFQTLNFARILPYVQSQSVADYLELTIRSVINEMKSTV